jgi:tRNA G18 (ribose-2'-O)-methylase SpoU
MTPFIHQRHKPPLPSAGASDLILACPPLRSNVNLSRIVRVAGCCGVKQIIACGNPKIDREIARDALEQIELSVHRSLEPVLRKLRTDGHRLVGLEQTTNSVCLYEYRFQPRSVLVIGHERLGIEPEILALLHEVVEIPVYGQPAGYNVATAVSMALYECCRQAAIGGQHGRTIQISSINGLASNE